MRFEGVIKTWNDERGFGFIVPTQGGPDVFVHVKAFAPRYGRPQAGQRVIFEIEPSRDGRKRAKAVHRLRPAGPAAPRRASRTTGWSRTSGFALAGFAVVYVAATVAWRIPLWVAAFYLVASIASILAYAIDKSAAEAGRWRVSEATLLSMGLLCGWPGAILAQQILRHKSSKASFRSTFWATVGLNVAGFLLLASPLRADLLGM